MSICRNFIIATELTDGGHNINQQYADLMQKTPQDIVNIKRRLLNVKGIKELVMGNEEKSVDLKDEFLARLFGNASELGGGRARPAF